MKNILFLVLILIVSSACKNQNGNTQEESNKKANTETYEEKVRSVEDIERSEPLKFLSNSATCDKNFWGDKIKIHGEISNSATVAEFKDVVIRVTFYSKTNTVIKADSYTVYDFFPPKSTKKYELKINNCKDAAIYNFEIESATPR